MFDLSPSSLKSGPLDAFPLWAFFLSSTAVILVGLELGYRIGHWRHAHASEEKESPVGAMVGSVLALLAIMLAFTFNLAASRFDARRQAVLEEANAIGTAYLRAGLLHEPERADIMALLREYVDVRVNAMVTGEMEQGIARSEKLQKRLWADATAAADKNPGLITTGLFIQSLNQVIDIHAKRVLIGLHNRMPLPIWIALFALALVGMISMGYQAGLSATRRSPAMVLLALAFSAVLYLIVDLDRGTEGMLLVSQQAMTELQHNMH